MRKPTAEEILSHRTDLLAQWRTAHSNFREWEDLYDLKHTIRVVSPAQPRKLSTARSKIDAMNDTLLTHSPTVKRRPVREGQAHQEKADKVEKWGKALLRRLASRTDILPPFRQAARNLTLYGYTNMAARWNKKAWPDKPRKGTSQAALDRMERWEHQRATAFPFSIDAPHPARFLMPPFERVPSIVIESATSYAWQVEEDYGVELRGSPFSLAEIVLFSHEEWQGLIIDGAEVYIRPNQLGFVPYAQALAGFGMEHSPNYNTGPGTTETPNLGPKPEDLAIGLLMPVKDSIIAQDEWHSAILSLALRAAYVTIFTEGDANELSAALEEAGLGGVIEGKKPEWEEVPNVQQWMLQAHALARQDIDQGTFAGEVQGQRSPGVDTATQHAMLLGTARQRFGVPMLQLNYMAEQLLSFCARMVVERGEAVTIDGVRIVADDFEGFYEFTVDFLAEDEATKLRKQEMGLRMLAQGALDLRTFHEEYAGIDDATEANRRIIVDLAMKSPQILEVVLQAADQIFRQRRAQEGIMLAPSGPAAPNGGTPGLISEPGGAIEQTQATQGMRQIPGEGISRTLPS